MLKSIVLYNQVNKHTYLVSSHSWLQFLKGIENRAILKWCLDTILHTKLSRLTTHFIIPPWMHVPLDLFWIDPLSCRILLLRTGMNWRFQLLYTIQPYKYPLVTHNPNMFKKVTGELSWEIKSVSSRKEIVNFLLEIVHTVSTRLCTNLGISERSKPLFQKQLSFKDSPRSNEDQNNSPFESRFQSLFVVTPLHLN